ncbi:MAG: hypothetical protein PHN37_01210 [Candidatus Pacebacteria bacterium]|nr:hypothetical protein [Candidatus Paceibacterota bacterium]
MPLEVKRSNEHENSQNLIRRFSKKMKQSGILIEARKKVYKKRPLSPQLKKRAALRREELKKEYQKLAKLGKLKK